jgi:hypothetical protein
MRIPRFRIRTLMVAVALIAIVTSACVLRTGRAQTKKVMIPRDLKIIASYDPGFGGSLGWDTTVTADGKAVQVVGAGESEKSTSRTLTAGELQDLVRKLEEVRYFRLGPLIGDLAPDVSFRGLKVTADGRTREVRLYPPALRERGESAERFFVVWDAVLQICPAPKRD